MLLYMTLRLSFPFPPLILVQALIMNPAAILIPFPPLHFFALASHSCLFRKVQIIGQPLPRHHLIDRQPRVPVGKRSKVQETPRHDTQYHNGGDPTRQQTPAADLLSHRPTRGSTGRREGLFLFRRQDSCGVGGYNVANVAVKRLEVEDEFEQGAGDEGRCEVGGEVVVEE